MQVYPPVSGGGIRTSGIAESLAQHGIEVHLFSLIGRKSDFLKKSGFSKSTQIVNVREFVLRPIFLTIIGILSYKLGIFPFWAWAWFKICGRFSKPLKELLTGTDVVIADFPFVCPVFDLSGNARKILNTHNIEAHLASGVLAKNIITYLENKACKSADLVVACSSSDAKFFSQFSRAEPLIIPNCIQLNQFKRDENLRIEWRKRLHLEKKIVCLFSASAYGPNREGLEFLKEFHVENTAYLREKNIVFLVVGSVSHEAFKSDTLIVTGRVEAVQPYFQSADFALNPIFKGQGTSIKVAEYIASGLPILTTVVGMRGYDLKDGESTMVFCKGDFKEKLEQLLSLVDPVQFAEKALSQNIATIDFNTAAWPLSKWIKFNG